jgi:hypothetical protein
MTRLIEIDDAKDGAPSLSVKVGDLLVFSASGGRTNTNDPSVRLVGVFVRAIIGVNRTVIEPMGPPNTVVFEARQQGQTTIDVISGDPFGAAASSTTLLIVVEA